MRWKPGYRPGGKTDWPVVDRPVVSMAGQSRSRASALLQIFCTAPRLNRRLVFIWRRLSLACSLSLNIVRNCRIDSLLLA